ncbi:hypothetical protein M2273_005105 [Mucilaginibacter lappiensis]|jgi:hypothetical protein
MFSEGHFKMYITCIFSFKYSLRLPVKLQDIKMNKLNKID